MAPAKSSSTDKASDPIRDIADRVKSVRLRLGLSQEDFAHRLKVPRKHLSGIETYAIEPSLRVILGMMLLHMYAGEGIDERISADWLLLGPCFDQASLHQFLGERLYDERRAGGD
jgi:transcriptional regulator with XRE-family HTH domain